MEHRFRKLTLMAACMLMLAGGIPVRSQDQSQPAPAHCDNNSGAARGARTGSGSSSSAPEAVPPAVPDQPASPAIETAPSAKPVSATATGAQPAAYPVEMKSLRLMDSSRNKNLPVTVLFPVGDGNFPLIIFSHGVLGSPDTYHHLASYWAQHGYVVLLPVHDDSLAHPKNRTNFMIPDIVLDVVKEPKIWSDHVRDITFLMNSDTLEQLQTKVPALAGHIDGNVIGVGGHSFGAYNASLIAGATVTVDGKKKVFGDPRPRAFILLSPQGSDEMGLTDSSWKGMARPFITYTGTYDFGENGDSYKWRAQGFRSAPPGNKYLIVFSRANHMSFTDRLAFELKDPAQKQIFQYLQRTTLAFWDAYLKNDATAKAYLNAANLKKASKGVITLTAR